MSSPSSVPAERRAAAVWQACAEDAAVFGGGGWLIGSAVALTLVRPTRPLLRGVLIGMGIGGGLGYTFERCQEKFAGLQSSRSE